MISLKGQNSKKHIPSIINVFISSFIFILSYRISLENRDWKYRKPGAWILCITKGKNSEGSFRTQNPDSLCYDMGNNSGNNQSNQFLLTRDTDTHQYSSSSEGMFSTLHQFGQRNSGIKNSGKFLIRHEISDKSQKDQMN